MNDESTPKGAHESATTSLMVTAGTVTGQEARRRRDRIKLLLTSLTEKKGKLLGLIAEAQENGDHTALGYTNFALYAEGEFGQLLAALTGADRSDAVRALADLGLSTRSIGSIVSAGKSTVARDLGAPVPDGTGDDRRVTGRDGKSYTAHGRPVFPVVEPKKPRRPALPDQFRTAVWNLDKAIRRLEVIAADDRFDPDQETYRHHEPLLREHLNKLTNIFGAYLSDGDRRVVDEVLRGSR
jgi:hypothetical protein